MQSTIMQVIGAGDLPDEGMVAVHVWGDGSQGQSCCIQPCGAALLQAEYRCCPPYGHWDTFHERGGDGAEGTVDEDVVVAVHGL